MSETILAAIISGLLGVGGAVGGVIPGNRLSKNASAKAISISNSNAISIMRKQEFNRASARLRAAFAPAKAHIRFPQSLGNEEARSFFEKAFVHHAVAIEEFRPFAKDSVAYQNAWNEYQATINGDDAMGDADLKWSSGFITHDEKTGNLDFLPYIESKIDNILHFSQPNN